MGSRNFKMGEDSSELLIVLPTFFGRFSFWIRTSMVDFFFLSSIFKCSILHEEPDRFLFLIARTR